MQSVIREINGQPVEFNKAQESHVEGNECLHLGLQGDNAYVYESDNPSLVIATTRNRLRIFAKAVVNGEFAL